MIGTMDVTVDNKVMLLSNLSFDHPLSDSELGDLVELLSNPINVSQIYFKDDIDIESIEKVKLLLEGLPNINDAKIEKYIMKKINSDDKEKLSNINFLNIDTWNIAYAKEDNRCSITSLAKYRKINEWFREVMEIANSDSISLMDKIVYFYDKVKLFEYDLSSKYGRIPEIICDGKANSYGYNLVFKELLSMIGIPAMLGNISIDNSDNCITIVKINDDHYQVDGVYLFDPSSDTISKDQYKNNLARRMNYNFFAITMDKLNKLNLSVRYAGLFKVLATKDEAEFTHNLNNYKRRNGVEKITKVKDNFKMNIEDLHSNIINSSDISDDTIFDIISNRLNGNIITSVDQELLEKTIYENYIIRNKELFGNRSVKKMSKIDN